VDSYER